MPPPTDNRSGTPENPDSHQLAGGLSSEASAPLRVAAGLALVEGLVLAALGVLEVAHLAGSRITMGVTSSLFFLAFAALLLASSWGLWRARSWARGPVLLAQIIALGLAWNFRGGETAAVSVALTVVAVAALIGLFNRRSTAALEHSGPEA